MILDLDFSEGDRIHVLTNHAGLFDNDIDPDNPLMIGADRSSAMIDSLADLQEIITSGAMRYTSDGLGGGVLALADGTGFGLVLANVDPAVHQTHRARCFRNDRSLRTSPVPYRRRRACRASDVRHPPYDRRPSARHETSRRNPVSGCPRRSDGHYPQTR